MFRRIAFNLTLPFCFIAAALAFACSSNSLVGKWRAVQKYDRFQGRWEPADEGVYLQFASDSSYIATTSGKLTRGNYKVESSEGLNHLVLKDDQSRTINAAFKADTGSLTLKGYTDDGLQFPSTLEPGGDEANFELIRFERQN